VFIPRSHWNAALVVIRTGSVGIAVAIVLAACGGTGSLAHDLGAAHSESSLTVTDPAGGGPTGIGRALLSEDQMKGFLVTRVVGADTATSWVALQNLSAAGAAAAERLLIRGDFVQGLREFLRGTQTKGSSVAEQFGKPAGAEGTLRRQISQLQGRVQGGVRSRKFRVPGVPNSSGFVFTAPPPHVEVVFSRGDYFVEISRGGNAFAASVSAAARSLYLQLAK
jgi:hypothetical protein